MHTIRKSFVIYFSLFLICYYASPSWADSTLDETRKLLQKGLTIHEIDRELERLSDMEADISKELQSLGEDIALQNLQVDEKRLAAGKVLRAYYMGQRESMYLSLLSMDNFYNLLVAFDFMQLIFKQDKVTLQHYRNSLDHLMDLRSELLTMQNQLESVKYAYLAERNKLVALQEELDLDLTFLDAVEAARLREQIHSLTAEWESKGLPLFQQYFVALAEVMEQLPEIIALNDGHLQIKNSSILFLITDEQLNEFIRARNALLNDLSFRFVDGNIVAEGEKDDIVIRIEGHYALSTLEENKIDFNLDALYFQKFLLPQSTVLSLAEWVDLGIYPDYFNPPVQALGIEMNGNELTIKLKPKGSWFESLFGKAF